MLFIIIITQLKKNFINLKNLINFELAQILA